MKDRPRFHDGLRLRSFAAPHQNLLSSSRLRMGFAPNGGVREE